MTLDIGTAKTLKTKRNRKLPRRDIVDADFVVPTSNKAIEDLLLERAPSQHDRSILSELWGGNASKFDIGAMPSVSIGKPKRALHFDSSTRPKTYKDMLKETHKDDWKLDLSNLTFVPSIAKGKHIRSYHDSKPPITETLTETVYEGEKQNMDTNYPASMDDKLKIASSDDIVQIDCSDAGNPSDLDKDKHFQDNINTEIDIFDDITTKPDADYTSLLQNTNIIPKGDYSEHPIDQNKSSNNCSAAGQERASLFSVDDAANDSTHDRDVISDAIDNDLYGHSDDECMVDQSITEKLRQLPIVQNPENGDDRLNDLNETEIFNKPLSEVSQEPQMAETRTSISSSSEIVKDRQMVQKTRMAENDKLKQDLPIPLAQFIPSAKDNTNNTLLFDRIEDEYDDDKKADEQVYEQFQQIIKTPLLRHLLASETKNSRTISKKNTQGEKPPLLNLNSSVSNAEKYIKLKPKIFKKWQRNQKKHRILNILKGTTALNWIENGKDIPEKKDLGFVRKRQLHQRFDKPFVIKKFMKDCWIVEDY
ncbi:hypothetical protein [Parasitella parasitica]|uniref:Uncharacterized protein n=1 Tax=Parasitella parasitica TaxID=35722 RepID=A0A0B7MWI2_9FUNG|nr:hypothetical protein [Parasitella parasitica]